MSVVFCTSTDKIDGLATRRTVFDIFTAVIKATLIFLRPNVLHFGYLVLPGTGLVRFGDVYEQ